MAEEKVKEKFEIPFDENDAIEPPEQKDEYQPLVVQKTELLTDDVLKRAEIQVNGLNKVKLLCMRSTNSRDWIKSGDNPYLTLNGTMKIRQVWGITIKDTKIECETIKDESGTYKLFTCSGKAIWQGHTIEDIGTCSTRDDFFGKKDKKFKLLEDVDLENIKKKAYTNFQNRILKKILGFNPTWEDLKEAGIDIDKISKVTYASGGLGGGLISEGQRKRLYAIWTSAKKKDDDVKKYLVEKYPYTEGHTSKIKTSDYETICNWAEKK